MAELLRQNVIAIDVLLPAGREIRDIEREVRELFNKHFGLKSLPHVTVVQSNFTVDALPIKEPV